MEYFRYKITGAMTYVELYTQSKIDNAKWTHFNSFSVTLFQLIDKNTA